MIVFLLNNIGKTFCPVLNLPTDDRAERNENKMGAKNSLDTVFSLQTSCHDILKLAFSGNILQTPTLHAG